MTKDELIARLKQLRSEEELAILVYTKHLESTFFFSRIKAEDREEITKTLLTLAMESEVHARMFEGAIQKLRDSERDVY
jgi:hypothetical protein